MMGVGRMPGVRAGCNPLPPVASDPVCPVVHRFVPRGLYKKRVIGGGSRKRRNLGIGTEQRKNIIFFVVSQCFFTRIGPWHGQNTVEKNAIHLGDATNGGKNNNKKLHNLNNDM